MLAGIDLDSGQPAAALYVFECYKCVCVCVYRTVPYTAGRHRLGLRSSCCRFVCVCVCVRVCVYPTLFHILLADIDFDSGHHAVICVCVCVCVSVCVCACVSHTFPYILALPLNFPMRQRSQVRIARTINVRCTHGAVDIYFCRYMLTKINGMNERFSGQPIIQCKPTVRTIYHAAKILFLGGAASSHPLKYINS